MAANQPWTLKSLSVHWSGTQPSPKKPSPPGFSLLDIPDDALALIVANITSSAVAQVNPKSIAARLRTLRTLSALSRSCKAINEMMVGRMSELRGLPVEVWEATSHAVPAQLTWDINDWANLEGDRLYSPAFRHGERSWRLLLFPGGDEVERHRPGAPPHLSLYVDVADAAMLPYGWLREAHFVLTVVNKKKASKTIVKYARHDFESARRDWGFRELVPVKVVEDEKAGFVTGGQLTLHCKVWEVTEQMRVAERAALLQQKKASRAGGPGGSGVGASSASSTSLGSEGSATASRGWSPMASLRRRLSGLAVFVPGVARTQSSRRADENYRAIQLEYNTLANAAIE